MRNFYYERLLRRAKEFHRRHSLGVDEAGIYTNHVFEPDRLLTWWHDLEFILNNRRVMIWWAHPRMKYTDAIDDAAWRAAGAFPEGAELFPATDPQWKRVGRSRKKIASHRIRPAVAAVGEFYDRVNLLYDQLSVAGIDHFVTPSFEVGHYGWGTGVTLSVPLEVRTHADAVALSSLTRKLLRRQTTCSKEFADYRYGQRDWLGETEARAVDAQRRRSEFADAALG